MKNYILWLLTGIILLLMMYYAVWWDNHLQDSTQQSVRDERVFTGSLYGDVFLKSIVWSWVLRDITHEIDGYNSLYQSLDNMSAVYTFNDYEYIWILHQTVLVKLEWNWWFLPWFTIHDTGKECHRWNRPTGFVQQNNKLFMSVLDKCGAWSMDWYVSAYELKENGKRELASCYNYDNWSVFEHDSPEDYKDIWYYRWTWQFDKLKKESIEMCEGNIQIQYYR